MSPARKLNAGCGFPTVVCGILILVMSVVAYAQTAADSPEVETFAVLGCRNCHGGIGDGGRGQPGGPVIKNYSLPLRRFVGYVRLPMGLMPHYSPELGPDADLATLYRWLNGKDAIKNPVNLSLTPSAENSEAGKVKIEIRSERKEGAPELWPDSLQYRVTMITNGKAPVSNQTVEYQLGSENWLSATTDRRGETVLAAGSQKALQRLRIVAPTVPTVVVVEAIDTSEAGKYAVVGIGSAILKDHQ